MATIMYRLVQICTVINWPPGSGSVIIDYGSADPKEIFTDPQHCFNLRDFDVHNFNFTLLFLLRLVLEPDKKPVSGQVSEASNHS
jgi:hypothetical protein